MPGKGFASSWARHWRVQAEEAWRAWRAVMAAAVAEEREVVPVNEAMGSGVSLGGLIG